MLRLRPAVAATAWALAVIVVGGGCGDSDRSSPPGAEGGRVGESVADVVGGVPLAEPAAAFVRECREAAARLGFPVPCPTRLPLVAGQRLDCSRSPRCAATALGIFFLSVDGFDSDGRSREKVRHLIVEAREAPDTPPTPCYAGVPAGTLVVAGHEVTVLECPPMTAEAGATIRHGEGAHVEHVLGYWDRDGVRYAVSVHGTDDDSRALLEALISSIELVGP